MININNYNLTFDKIEILKNFNLSIEKGDIMGLYGPTGCGKTSILNKIVCDYISKYKISYVFQDNKLIENMTALKNVQLPLEKLYSKADARGRALKNLKLFNLEHKIQDKISVLSGGEKQRVNLARAFAYPCEIILLDEPFSAQDDDNRKKLIKICGDLIKERKITAVIVSHNLMELESLCNSIVKMGFSN